MRSVKVSEKGQVTLPAAMRRKLRIEASTVLEVETRGNEIVLRKVPPLSSAWGALSKYARPGATWEDEREAMEKAVAEEVEGA